MLDSDALGGGNFLPGDDDLLETPSGLLDEAVAERSKTPVAYALKCELNYAVLVGCWKPILLASLGR